MIASQRALMIFAMEVTRLLATSPNPSKIPAMNSTSIHATALMPFKNTWTFRLFSKLRLDARLLMNVDAEVSASSAPRLSASALRERLSATITGVTGARITAAPPITTNAPMSVNSPLPMVSQLRLPRPCNAGTSRFTAAAIMVRLIALPMVPFDRFSATTNAARPPATAVSPRPMDSQSISPNFATAS